MPPRAPAPDAWIPLGTLGRPRALAGAMWFHPHNTASSALGPGVTVRLVPVAGDPRAATIATLDDAGSGLVIRLVGVTTREGAEALTRATVELRRGEFPPLEPGEYYHVDLPGLAVVDLTGATVGEVLRVEAYPSVDALVVSTPQGELELPVTDDVVRSIDVPNGTVTVDLAALAAT